MSTNPDRDPRYASAEALAGLASDVDGVRKRMEPLHRLPGEMTRLSGLVDKLAEDLAKFLNRASPAAIPSWLLAPTDPDEVTELVVELVAWLDAVYLRYADAGLPDCWLWHPDVVEELLWLQHAWLAAYQGPTASVGLVGDWHDRYRPGVVRRLGRVQACSLDTHTTPASPRTAPLAEAAEPLIAWWATHRDDPPPAPTAEQLDSAAPLRRGGLGRR